MIMTRVLVLVAAAVLVLGMRAQRCGAQSVEDLEEPRPGVTGFSVIITEERLTDSDQYYEYSDAYGGDDWAEHGDWSLDHVGSIAVGLNVEMSGNVRSYMLGWIVPWAATSSKEQPFRTITVVDEDAGLVCQQITGIGMFCEGMDEGTGSEEVQLTASSQAEPRYPILGAHSSNPLNLGSEASRLNQVRSASDAPTKAWPSKPWCLKAWLRRVLAAEPGSLRERVIMAVIGVALTAFWLVTAVWSLFVACSWVVRLRGRSDGGSEVEEPLIPAGKHDMSRRQGTLWQPLKVVPTDAAGRDGKLGVRLSF